MFSVTTFDGLTMGFAKQALPRHECKHTAVPRTRVSRASSAAAALAPGPAHGY